MTIPGIVRALEQADSFREAVAAGAADAEYSVIEGLDAPLLAALLERRRAAGKPAVLLAIAATASRKESACSRARTIPGIVTAEVYGRPPTSAPRMSA